MDIVLGIVLIICIYILYCIFAKGDAVTNTEPFINLMPTNVEDTLGQIATLIKTPANFDAVGNNPTGLVASVANPINVSESINIQDRYHTAFGQKNTGPRIDDTNSLLYMIDFCYQKGKEGNPFSDTTFATNCGMCMTSGTLLNGTSFTDQNVNGSGTNGTGVVVYPSDKDYSRKQGLQASPSAHAATCAPLVGYNSSNPNITSLAINVDQYTATKGYIMSNSYTMAVGTAAGEHTIVCNGSKNDHPFVIKDGFFRDGAWDIHLDPMHPDYSRINELNTNPLPSSCKEETSCTINTQFRQFDISALCGYPKPSSITNLKVDKTKTTNSRLAFTWEGGLYADNYDFQLINQDTMNNEGTATKDPTENRVTYTGLTANTSYKFILTISNDAGTASGTSTTEHSD